MNQRIGTIEELEALYSQPLEMALKKETNTINPYYRQLIESAPFFAIATSSNEGLDVSPRGDPAGFVKVLDERTIAIPDRRGNNRLDTLRNILHSPSVALLFLIPGLNITLRYNGRAHLSVEPELLESMAMGDKAPVCAIVVELDTLFFQCARALKRAKLWDPSTQLDPDSLPTAGLLTKSAMPDFDAEQYDQALEERQNRTLY